MKANRNAKELTEVIKNRLEEMLLSNSFYLTTRPNDKIFAYLLLELKNVCFYELLL